MARLRRPPVLPAATRAARKRAYDRIFVDLYLGDASRNATEAARGAWYAVYGSPYPGRPSSLHNLAYYTLHKPRVARKIGRALAERTITDEELLGRLSSIAMMDPASTLRVRQGRNGEVIEAKVDLKDVVKAQEVLGKFKGLGRDPLDTLISRQLRKLARHVLPAPVVKLLPAGDETEDQDGVLPPVLSSTSRPLRSSRSTRDTPEANTDSSKTGMVEVEVDRNPGRNPDHTKKYTKVEVAEVLTPPPVPPARRK